jgi:hypothetical protein
MTDFPRPGRLLAHPKSYDFFAGSARWMDARSEGRRAPPQTKGDFYMGLDMYLTAEIYFMGGGHTGSYRKKAERFDAGYWRKHPDLHGYIVENFANGEDNCQPIELDKDSIKQIMSAIEGRQLPKTTGFFFGESDNDATQIKNDLEIFRKALDWLDAQQQGEWRSIEYQASW